MNKQKVFTVQALPSDVKEYLKKHVILNEWDQQGPLTREQLFNEVADVHGLITSGTPINEELLQSAPNLRVVSTVSVGYNHFDIEAMKKHRVLGTHTPFVLDDTVADLVIALMLSTARRIPELDALTKSGEWKKGTAGAMFGVDVHHKKLGIIGMGRIGEVIAKRAKFGFDMEVSYYNRNRNLEAEERLDVHAKELDQLLSESDFVVLMVPLTSETRNLIGEREFQLMKKSAIFINGSRGQTVDEESLIQALQTGEILAAGLDVYQEEPTNPNNPLLKMPNVVTLPHIGSATSETRHAMAMLAARNLVAALNGDDECFVVKELEDLSSTLE
ncbi:D-glycerate dehydrogenase [Anaerobacillus alkaliphilus]|uniref:Glyoxylate/hydroxypyruvate reductase B n=1 Tax=Anaerobacillus alkaliphilus TaxID=1548597 RepID=A0A4Q0VMX9_9BACI|nr:D-glycerate dehydrogenase [Anaerobacillus alkaliphilus]RXI96152.1 D-glycerate dehydrogenase [Anaerobacillus alkaliphilus]